MNAPILRLRVIGSDKDISMGICQQPLIQRFEFRKPEACERESDEITNERGS